jgi:hypothetical protein
VLWAPNPNTAAAFNADYVAIGRQINALPVEVPKYVVVQANGVPVNSIPMPAETVMFITDTYNQAGQTAKNVHYVLPGEESAIPQQGVNVFTLK